MLGASQNGRADLSLFYRHFVDSHGQRNPQILPIFHEVFPCSGAYVGWNPRLACRRMPDGEKHMGSGHRLRRAELSVDRPLNLGNGVWLGQSVRHRRTRCLGFPHRISARSEALLKHNDREDSRSFNRKAAPARAAGSRFLVALPLVTSQFAAGIAGKFFAPCLKACGWCRVVLPHVAALPAGEGNQYAGVALPARAKALLVRWRSKLIRSRHRGKSDLGQLGGTAHGRSDRGQFRFRA